MANDDIGTSLGHGGGLVRIENVGRRQHVLLVCQGHQINFLGIGHAGFLKIGTQDAINETYGRKILDARKANGLQVIQKLVKDAERISAVNTC